LLISEFTRTLLEHFIKQLECPPTLAVGPVNGSNDDSGTLYKIGQSVASGLWSVMTLGMASSSPSTTTENPNTNLTDSSYDLRNRHLANQSIHLILILSNHFTNDVHRNPYRLALLHFTDTQGDYNDFILLFFLTLMLFRQSNKSARFRTIALVFS